MSMDDTIIAAVMHERGLRVFGSNGERGRESKEARQINHYGRRMLAAAKSGRVKPTDSDQQIAQVITPVMAWLFWQIAPDLLLWIVGAIRRRIWGTGSTVTIEGPNS